MHCAGSAWFVAQHLSKRISEVVCGEQQPRVFAVVTQLLLPVRSRLPAPLLKLRSRHHAVSMPAHCIFETKARCCPQPMRASVTSANQREESEVQRLISDSVAGSGIIASRVTALPIGREHEQAGCHEMCVTVATRAIWWLRMVQRSRLTVTCRASEDTSVMNFWVAKDTKRTLRAAMPGK
jgi:hypothetical protein